MVIDMILHGILFCLLLIVSTHAIKSEGFLDCRHQFYRNLPPALEYMYEKVSDTKCLCENFNGKNYFAAFYDTNKKLPLFSAFTITQFERNEILTQKRIWRSGQGLEKGEQPNINDYNGIGVENLDRGHLATRSYFLTNEGRRAVDVLTNVALQDKTFNQNTWEFLEKSTLDASRDHCHYYGGKSFFITGVVPSDNKNFQPQRKPPNPQIKINIPSYFWTVVCCDTSRDSVDFTNRLNGWSFAYIGTNEKAAKDIDIITVEAFLKDERINKKFKKVSLFQSHGAWAFNPYRNRYVENCLYDPDKANTIMKDIREKYRLKLLKEAIKTGVVGPVSLRNLYWSYMWQKRQWWQY